MAIVASHGLAPKLSDFPPLHAAAGGRAARHASAGAGAVLARLDPQQTVELFLCAAQLISILGDGLGFPYCPRCRGAKSSVKHLHELPQGAHCASCNIDYGRDFTRNVELTFHPEPWLRPLPKGELCLLGQGTTPHVRFQAEVAAHSRRSFAVALPPGPYRFRTIEAGGEADARIADDDIIPEVEANSAEIVLRHAGPQGEFRHHQRHRPAAVLCHVEDRPTGAKDALARRARDPAMPAFRRLCPEQLLRPGDEVEIGRVAIVFTDLQGSTKLYDQLGDVSAYRLVRDHFAYLSERIARHHGFILKTVGDAVMAAFHDPADAVRAVLSMQDEVASFNRGRSDSGIVLKLGLHQGACIAVTAGGVLDYFGSAVNTASRLEHQCGGGEVIFSAAVLADAEAREALNGRDVTEDSATLRGLNEPVRFVRVGATKPPPFPPPQVGEG